ncbi:MAG: glycosyltransferase [Bacteroidia bacterium]|nr:glycosyltransferase [Bacteroidia bacterium]
MTTKHQQKKILIVGPAHPLRGGLATYNERLCKEFTQMGHSCSILSFSLQYPSFLFPGKTQLSTDVAPAGIQIFSEINSINPINWISVGLKFKKQNYDIVIFRYWMSFMAPAFGTIARILKSNKRTTILAITDNVNPHERKFFDKAFTNYFLPVCDGFLTMSESVKQDLIELKLTQPTAYVPHPMYDTFGAQMEKDVAKEKLGWQKNEKYILFFGFIRKYKGLSILLDAMANPLIKSLNIKLVVAGEFYEDKKPYLEQIEKLQLQNNVIVCDDFIPNNEVSAYFCASDVVVQPYLNATQSGVTQIAYYYNKPMIVTNVGGLAELIPHNKVGLVCDVDSQKIAEAIHTYYSSNKEQEFSANAAIEKQRFTWDNLCQSLLNL